MMCLENGAHRLTYTARKDDISPHQPFGRFGTCARASRGKARIFAGLNGGGSCPEAWCVQFAASANELPGATRGVLEDPDNRLLSRVPAKTGSLGRSKCKKLNQIKTIVLKIEPDGSDARVTSHLEKLARSKSCPAHPFLAGLAQWLGLYSGKSANHQKFASQQAPRHLPCPHFPGV